MRLVRFRYKNSVLNGVLKGKEVIFNSGKGEKCSVELDKLSLLAPVEPSKIVAVGLNYSSHARELGRKTPDEPILFIKPSTAVIGPNDVIRYPACSRRVDYEAELAVVIKDRVRNVSKKDATKHILGYTCFNDVTARDLQEKDGQWTRAKSFDTFAAIGPWIETDLDASNLSVKCYLNGQLKQSARTSDFIFGIPRLIEFISGIMTLVAGDVITTGTPAGIGAMKIGDEVTVEIEGIGRLTNHVG